MIYTPSIKVSNMKKDLAPMKYSLFSKRKCEYIYANISASDDSERQKNFVEDGGPRHPFLFNVTSVLQITWII